MVKNQKNVKQAKESILYEIFIHSFYDSDGDGIGDFNGMAEKLDYIETLRADALWLMPFNESPSYHGYEQQITMIPVQTTVVQTILKI